MGGTLVWLFRKLEIAATCAPSACSRNSVPTNARGVSSPHQEADEATHLLVLPPRRVQAGENVSWNHSTNVRSYRRENPAMPQVQQKQQLVLERQAWDLQLARLNVVPSEHTAAWDASTNVKSTRVVSPLQQGTARLHRTGNNGASSNHYRPGPCA
ncbi:hypothetical protein H257_01345 [Aphanomyces astaci]|uniref:Uncharacterized protein n=1 Tax=Aphanomyces astaci TaxID=112090 RepID=W4H9Z7_APHAT|nr:hypothetical protein H257_01345 [Aphanomyces astaci]ETV87943.1 hypothetical protein H257_01345 [Aphanomyces astaci]|eukprot:XP_009822806.1 hypothetical protein H257_01345 [Aphanomyces astaci]